MFWFFNGFQCFYCHITNTSHIDFLKYIIFVLLKTDIVFFVLYLKINKFKKCIYTIYRFPRAKRLRIRLISKYKFKDPDCTLLLLVSSTRVGIIHFFVRFSCCQICFSFTRHKKLIVNPHFSCKPLIQRYRRSKKKKENRV